MYVEGIQIGTNSYLLSEDDGNIKIINGIESKERMEEYIKLENKYEEKLEEKNKLQEKKQKINELEKGSKKTSLIILISLILAGGLYIITRGITTGFALLGAPVVMMSGIMLIFKPLIYSTKRKRKKQKLY